MTSIWQNVSTPTDMLQMANTNTEGYFWVTILNNVICYYLLFINLLLSFLRFIIILVLINAVGYFLIRRFSPY
jgi:hypothetical protein